MSLQRSQMTFSSQIAPSEASGELNTPGCRQGRADTRPLLLLQPHPRTSQSTDGYKKYVWEKKKQSDK